MRLEECCARNEIEKMCESYRGIVKDFGSKKDQIQVKRMDDSDFEDLISKIQKEDFTKDQINKFFL